MAHRIAPEAVTDLDDVWLYLAQETGRLDIADRQVDAITRRFVLLSRHPYLGRSREDLRPGLRSSVVGPHVILYRATPSGDVLILRVIHVRQDIGPALGAMGG